MVILYPMHFALYPMLYTHCSIFLSFSPSNLLTLSPSDLLLPAAILSIPQPEIWNPQSNILTWNPKPHTLNHIPYTLYHIPYALNLRSLAMRHAPLAVRREPSAVRRFYSPTTFVILSIPGSVNWSSASRAIVEKLYITAPSSRAWNQCFSPGARVNWSQGFMTISLRMV